MKPEEIIEKYYAGQNELKLLLLKHSIQVAQKAMEVLDKHPEIQADRRFVYEAAMLHDIGILHTCAPGIGCIGTQPYICHGMLGAEILRKEGLPLHARVAERHTGTGLTKETILRQALPLPPNDFTPETIEEQIICYADKFFSKTRLDSEDSYERVEKKMQKWGDESVEQLRRWREMFE